MRLFLRWEYRVQKVLASMQDPTGLQTSAATQARALDLVNAKILEHPIFIDEVREMLEMDPHPDTRFGTGSNRGKKFLSDPNVDHPEDGDIPQVVWDLLPEPVRTAIGSRTDPDS
jgi:hypothetical protein